jgi:quinolinate synthase
MSINREVLNAEIQRLKKEKGAVILAHNYQIPDIQNVADYLGDSLELSRISAKLVEKLIIFCGVKFMAETAKILSPQKRIILPVLEAGCPLADTIEPEEVEELKKKHPGAWVVSYVNIAASVKALSDVCCTSSNAIQVVRGIPAKKVIFVPDKNLGWWVKKNVPEKEIIVWQGFCYVHEQFTLKDLEEAKKNFPEAEVLAHPECRSEILEKADYVVSTAGMLKRAKESGAKVFIIGTEEALVYRLQKENPQKEFYSLGTARTCINMKKTTLNELHRALSHEIYEIELDEQIIKQAKTALERMVEYI